MKRLLVISVVILFAVGGATAEITASLEVLADQDTTAGPYRRAELTITNSAGAAVETVMLKPAGVGLTVRYKLTVPPGSDGKQLIFLPAISPAQEYAVTALDASGEVVARTSAAITWPAELVTADAFIDDAFRAWTDDPARWSVKSRWNYLFALAMFVTIAAATLLIRRPLLRVGAVVVITGAVTALIIFVYIPAERSETVQVHRCKLVLYDSDEFKIDSFAVLSARRTTKRQSRPTWSLSYPVWPDRAAAASDDAVAITTSGNIPCTLELTLHPGQVRIIRPAWLDFPVAITRLLRGTVRMDADGFTVEVDFIHQGALLIRNDSVWRLGSAAGERKASVRTDQAESYAAFMSSEDGRNLDLHVRRLLNYWRNKHQQAEKVYLVEPNGGEAGANITVVQLEEVSAW